MKTIDFIDIQLKEYIESIRPPEEVRDQIDIWYLYINNVVEIYEIRPKWDDKTISQHFPIARAKFVKSQNRWRIYWLSGNNKWLPYTPKPEVGKLYEFIELIKNDKSGCFWG